MKPLLAVVLAVWFVVVFLLGAGGAMARQPGTPPIPVLIGVTAPVIVFLVAYQVWPGFRAFVLSLDLSLAAGVQAWRAGGLGFLALYAYGVLPGAFAWPAGLGDIAIGVTAPWVAGRSSAEPVLRSAGSSRSGICSGSWTWSWR